MSEFYTQHGTEGSKYSKTLSTKEIAAIIRKQLKEKHPDCKFSVTTSLYSGGSSIAIKLMEAPIYPQKGDEETIIRTINEYYINEDEKLTDEAKKLLMDVKKIVLSYHMDDSDSMIDYFNTNFYYSIAIGSYEKPFQVVKKEKKTIVAVAAIAPSEKNQGKYTISEDIHTKTYEKIWTVKFADKLSKNEYIEMAKTIESIGGYYSKFKHAFVFHKDPSENLKTLFI